MTNARPSERASVIVALNPHAHDLGAVMDAWDRQAEAGEYEVIVVDNGARPSAGADYARHRDAHPGTPVRLVDGSAPGRAALNNAGVRASRGSLLMFVADDFVPSRMLVAAHRRFHACHAAPVVGVGGSFYGDRYRDDPFRRWMEDSGTLYGFPFPLAALRFQDGYFFVGNASMSRATHEAIGAFDERFHHDLFDDYEYSRRIRARGVRTRYVPRAFAWHDHEVTLEERLVAMGRLGEAVRTYEHGGDDAGPLAWLTTQSIEVLEAELAKEGRDPGAIATIGSRKRRWELEMAVAFLRSYHAAAPM